MRLTKKDIAAIILVIASAIMYGSQYFLENKLGDFQNAYSWISLVLLVLALLYLFIVYFKK